MHSKPKRRYTVSEKVLAANRLNLIKARAVPNEIRYRGTPARLRSCYESLLRAQRAVREGGHPCYAPCFRTGVYAASLERSAPLAGETREAFRHHLGLFERALEPEDDLERRLVRGLAEAVWRRLRAFRGQANWERRAVERVLRLGAERVRRAGSAWPSVSEHLDTILAGELWGIMASDHRLLTWLPKLEERVEQVGRLLALAQGQVPTAFFTDPRLGDQRLLKLPAAALGNPFVSPRQVAHILRAKPPRALAHTKWDWNPQPPSPFVADGYYFLDEAAGRRAMRFGLMSGALRSGQPPARSFEEFFELFAAGFALENWRIENGNRPCASYRRPYEIQNFSDVKELIIINAHFQNSVAAAAHQNSTPAPNSLLAPAEMVAAAQALWSRLEIYPRAAEEETARLHQFLEAVIAAKAGAPGSRNDAAPATTCKTGTPGAAAGEGDGPGRLTSAAGLGDAGPTTRLLAEILMLYQRDWEAMFKALEGTAAANLGLHALLTSRYGAKADFDDFLPSPELLWDNEQMRRDRVRKAEMALVPAHPNEFWRRAEESRGERVRQAAGLDAQEATIEIPDG